MTNPLGTLKPIAAIPAEAGNPDQSVDLGVVWALTTVAARAIELEIGSRRSEADSIVQAQLATLLQDVQAEHQSDGQQNDEINNPNLLDTNSETVVASAVNEELILAAGHKDRASAELALNGLTGFLQADEGKSVSLDPSVHAAFIAAVLRGQTDTPDRVAAMLNASGASSATAANVTESSLTIRDKLPGLVPFGVGISPYEALAIASGPPDVGGFQLGSASVNTFLTRLLAS